MSHIRWTNHPTNPSLNGTKAHVSRSVAEVASAYEQAVLLPRPNYGTPEWAAERAQADAGRKAQPGDNAAPFVDGVQWCIQNHPLAGVVIVKSSGSETTRFKDADTAHHYGAPKELCKELTRLIKEQTKKNIEAERIEAGNSWGPKVNFI